MIVKGKDISAEAVQWTGWNADELLSVFGEGHIFFGHGHDKVRGCQPGRQEVLGVGPGRPGVRGRGSLGYADAGEGDKMKSDELKAYKNIERVFDATMQQEQVIAENSDGYRRGFNSCEEFYPKEDVEAVLVKKDAEIRRLNRLLWNARATAAKNAAGEVHNLIVCMRERHPDITLSNTEAREREFLEKARRCRRKAREWR